MKNKYLKLWGYLLAIRPRDFSQRRGPAVRCRVNTPKALNICFPNGTPRKLKLFFENESHLFFMFQRKEDFRFRKKQISFRALSFQTQIFKRLRVFTRHPTAGLPPARRSRGRMPGKYPQMRKYLILKLKTSEAHPFLRK